ncbi:MAG: PEP-CTERM sorting domain-containing protein, partial [Stellaceae bacterium]
AGLLGAALTVSANAAAVVPNASFTFANFPASVNTGDITSTTTSLVAGGPDPSITKFTDPFLGNPDNFCAVAGGGCTGPHPPGFLLADFSIVNIQNPNLPVGNKLPTPIAELVQAVSGGAIEAEAEFDYTSVSTTGLAPTTSSSEGMLQLAFLGTFAGDSNSVYATGQSADMTLSCLQPTFGAPLACDGAIDTPSAMLPPAPLPEPASTAFLGATLFGFAALRRRRYSFKSRRALPFSSFSVSSGDKGSVLVHSVPGGFSTNG